VEQLKVKALDSSPITAKKRKKMGFLYAMEFYSSMKMNEILSFADKWMKLENIILSEVIQAQKAKGHMFSLICGIQAQYNRGNVIFTYKYIQNMYPKVGLAEETKRGEKEARKDGE
jgi:hypothetical protein